MAEAGDRPSVGVVIPTYNDAAHLERCVDSVLNQSVGPSKIYLCDDCSTDGTRDIIRKYAADYPGLLEALLNERNRGAGGNFNTGLKRVTEKYSSIVAGDDYWHPRKLEMELKALERAPQSRWAYSRSVIVDECGERMRSFDREYEGEEGDILFHVLTHQMALRNWLAETDLVKEAGYFDESFSLFEDWDFKIRMAAISPVVHVDEENVFYRKGSGLSASGPDRMMENLLGVYSKHDERIQGLPGPQRDKVQMYKRRDMARYCRMALESCMEGGRGPLSGRSAAMKYFIKYFGHNPRETEFTLLLKVILPRAAYDGLRKVYRQATAEGENERPFS